MWICFILAITLFTASGAAEAARGGVFPTAEETAFLALVNKARANPAEALSSAGIDPGILENGGSTEAGETESLIPAVRLSPILTAAAAELTEWWLAEGWKSRGDDPEERLGPVLDRWGYVAGKAGFLTGMVGFANYLDPRQASRILFESLLKQDLTGEGAPRLILDPTVEEIGVFFDGVVVSYEHGAFNAYILVFTAAERQKVDREALQLGNMINQARALPEDTAWALGLDPPPAGGAGSVEALPPMRWNRHLYAASREHAADMLAREYCDTVNPEGVSAADRALAAGYGGTPAGEWVGAIGLCGDDGWDQRVSRLFRRVFLSEWFSPAEERLVLSAGAGEFAAGFATGAAPALGGICGIEVALAAIDVGSAAADDAGAADGGGAAYGGGLVLVSGVLYRDGDGDGLYGPGEGLAGLEVTVTGSPGVLTVLTDPAGGFAAPLPPGEYAFSASGEDGTAAASVSVTGEKGVYVPLPYHGILAGT